MEYKASRIKQWPVVSNRASDLGHECLRYLVFMRTRWREKTLHGVRLQSIFDEGNIHEEAVLSDLRKAGIQIIEQQRAFEWKQYQITGHIDAKAIMDGKVIPLEIKSSSPFVWKAINTVDDLKHGKYHYLRKYPAQMTLYLLMDEKNMGMFIFKDKTTGLLKEIPMELDYELGEKLLQKAEAINQHVAEGTIPPCCEYDEQLCGECGFLHICLPEIKRDALEFRVDPEMEGKITKWFSLKDASAEYTSLDKHIKETFREKEKIVVGDYLITGKPLKNGWRTNISKLEVTHG